MTKLAEVAVDVKHPAVKGEYYYIVPEPLKDKVRVGSRVKVPFNNSMVEGVVIRFLEPGDAVPDFQLKEIIDVDERFILPQFMLELARKLASYYSTNLIDFLKLMLPPSVSILKEAVYTTSVEEIGEIRSGTQKEVFRVIRDRGPATVDIISKITGLAKSSVRNALTALMKKGFIKRDYRVKSDIREFPQSEAQPVSHRLTYEQARALEEIIKNMEAERKPVLLFGITGSGKTEVYIKAIERLLARGKRALVLVPEISLTPQMMERFYNRFPGRVAMIHSGLSRSERFLEWYRIYKGDADITIGARSAIFAPIKDLGLIIIDEEHESSYKQVEFPFYDARQVACFRAEAEGAAIIFGSATPSVESFYRAVKGEYIFLKLTRRVSGRPLPPIEIVDMREELKSGNRHIFSRKLCSEMEAALSRGEQVILFLNRRGHSTFVLCRDCGFVLKCPHCDISLTYHSIDKSGRCHYCGYRVKAPDTCPDCDSRNIRFFGAGTEKVEQEFKIRFPGVNVVRVDADSTSRKGSLQRMLSEFKSGKAQVMIGTQSIAKGLDFPGVSLVGIIAADTTLNLPDFRAGERTFQLISQVAGRAGRGQIPGKVIVQTYSPESSAVIAACGYNYKAFYREELMNRKKFEYPPFCHMMNLTFTGADQDLVRIAAEDVKKILEHRISPVVKILGPIPAPRFRVKDNFRYNILLKSTEPERLIEAGEVLKNLKNLNKKVYLTWDMDPQDLL
ncbi:replication restart helicase PriA [Thermosediminibacter oceani]|uniref:Replication restart protein PriA n=1 Tax=Thermosediminibacter oceani (strain ATCC BAA-1034 / DSM 16646 / JW/IW-1228P) TaxID=555079 RepID=D9S310_THEOJ|nr:primosomal protein N' [Thermosediminibacter oceani]ADL07787.1 transcriptional regulator, TrmB [Thermosediminibacter oceani DSM 16646]